MAAREPIPKTKADPRRLQGNPQKRQQTSPPGQPTAVLLDGADDTACRPEPDALEELDDEIARKVQRKLQRHRDKQLKHRA